jgi:hypothetical protein
MRSILFEDSDAARKVHEFTARVDTRRCDQNVRAKDASLRRKPCAQRMRRCESPARKGKELWALDDSPHPTPRRAAGMHT